MFGSLPRKADGRASSPASDEVPFLADEEKDGFGLLQSPLERKTWTSWPLYSVFFNVLLLLILVSNWRVLGRDPNKAYIPNEIYCK